MGVDVIKKQQLGNGALLPAVEEAVSGRGQILALGAEVTVVTTSDILRTGIVTVTERRNRHQEVEGLT